MIDYIVVPLGEILDNKEYNIKKIEDAFKRFSCQREIDLETFLVKRAIVYENANHGKTYLCLDKCALTKGDFIILAYFTLAQRAVDITNFSKKKKKNLLGSFPGRDNVTSITSYLIGQLGRNDECSSDKLSGNQLLNECYHAISMAARIVGGKLIVLECREHMFEKFYEKNDFKKLYDEVDENKLYTLYKKIDFNLYWQS